LSSVVFPPNRIGKRQLAIIPSVLQTPFMSTKVQTLLHPIGIIRSKIKTRADAPMQGYEGAPDVWLNVSKELAQALDGIAVGDDLIVMTWLHRAKRDVLRVHPRSDRRLPLTGVFATRSPDRPNPIGLHRVTVRRISGTRLRIGPIEVIDGTPVIDIKPVLGMVKDH
jgi:tRNA-Thr(GGU) m(6)t(6)A37 methyltransferase TsaA